MPKIVLLGGGHAHLIAVPALAESVRGHADLCLIASAEHLLYSGMMPGWIAGQYDYDECAIHLRTVCERNAVQWIEDEIVDIDFDARVARGLRGGYRFDIASVNVGSANLLGEIGPGAPPVLGAKPFAEFVSAWRGQHGDPGRSSAIRDAVVVGGGAAAVEIAFALRRCAPRSRITLATAGDKLLQPMSPIAGAIARASLRSRSVDVLFGHRYVGAGDGMACFESKPALRAGLIVVATGARPPQWLTQAASRHAVSVAHDGGLAVRADLRSVSHSGVFAAGDCASFVDRAVPKSGVHALRQGPVLAHNLALALARHEADAGRRAPLARNDAVRHYAPRRWTLALLNRCDGSAIAAWGALGFCGDWVWRWKDRIDRRFMARFDLAGRNAARARV